MTRITTSIFAALCATLFAAAAWAQSNPGLYQGQVPTAAQWNSYFSAKQDALGYFPLNRAGDSMLGRLTLFPSAAGGAGVNFGIGIVPTTPNNGDVWMTNSGIFFRLNGVTYGPISTGTGPGGSAFSATNDTNVTVALGGSYLTALLNPASITLGWTGQLAVTRGGTGLATVAQGDLLYGSAANTIASLAKSATATRYVANTGTSNSPAWDQVDLSNGVKNSLPVANLNGGTGATANTLWHGNATWAPVDLANDVSGNLDVSHLNSGTGASASTAWCGNGTWCTLTVSTPATRTITGADTIVAGDAGKTILLNCASNCTVALTAAATLGNGFWFNVKNINTGGTIATLDPNGAELIDGLSTTIFPQGDSARITGDGTGWQTQNRPADVLLSSGPLSSSSRAIYVPPGYAGYKLILNDVVSVTGGQEFNFQFGSGGANGSFVSTGYGFVYYYMKTTASSFTSGFLTSQQAGLISNAVASTATLGMSAVCDLNAIGNGVTLARMACSTDSSDGTDVYKATIGNYNDAVAAYNALKIFFASGNMTGNYAFYGKRRQY